MVLPTTGTVVSYPTGSTEGTGTVLHVEPVGERFAVLLDVTPCHPVDAGWPDQGADRATLTWNGGSAEVVDCVVAATDGSALHLGRDIPVRKGTEGWTFVVAHLVTEAPPVGIVVTVEVDEKYRKAISLGHTGCHLASLALNRAMAERWSKEVSLDALGSPNFDAEANDASRILERGSLDTYRLGKSLRKKGFRADGLGDDLPGIEDAVNGELDAWISEDAPVRIDCDGERLTDRRSWVCDLADGEARISCGGTHATRLGELKSLRATLTLDDVDGTPVLTMRTAQA
ncbi:alanyl-tRNA synthetase [Cryobacterium mesophilum]|uniref:Metal-dependent hydrolase n=1 Tax=Terrimesophilobacter mesophilus TaxID=433647 RepID=A0A4R8V9I2_9MICO|nr:metal-dependent hydrolase [Terrimesophilobacter mesophilus]MBB5632706.1 alanyl-tRNA synthetase [Terrimesophilobacter mesophilus]TFB79509.1 metal-dependent hydrolase [Terrimesophilobacter mesophilus]